MDEHEKTPRTCVACGGRSCRWCTGGHQDEVQQEEWKAFRSRMRRISGTYSALEGIVQDLVRRLEEVGTPESRECARLGKSCLDRWVSADPDTPERREASVEIQMFQKEAVIVLMKKISGA